MPAGALHATLVDVPVPSPAPHPTIGVAPAHYSPFLFGPPQKPAVQVLQVPQHTEKPGPDIQTFQAWQRISQLQQLLQQQNAKAQRFQAVAFEGQRHLRELQVEEERARQFFEAAATRNQRALYQQQALQAAAQTRQQALQAAAQNRQQATAIRNQRALYQQQALQAAAQNRQQALAWFSERKQLQEELKRAVTELQAREFQKAVLEGQHRMAEHQMDKERVRNFMQATALRNQRALYQSQALQEAGATQQQLQKMEAAAKDLQKQQLAAWGADQKHERAAWYFMAAAAQNRQQASAWFAERKRLQEMFYQAMAELQAKEFQSAAFQGQRRMAEQQVDQERVRNFLEASAAQLRNQRALYKSQAFQELGAAKQQFQRMLVAAKDLRKQQLATWGADQKHQRAAASLMASAAENKQQALAWFVERKRLQEAILFQAAALQEHHRAAKLQTDRVRNFLQATVTQLRNQHAMYQHQALQETGAAKQQSLKMAVAAKSLREQQMSAWMSDQKHKEAARNFMAAAAQNQQQASAWFAERKHLQEANKQYQVAAFEGQRRLAQEQWQKVHNFLQASVAQLRDQHARYQHQAVQAVEAAKHQFLRMVDAAKSLRKQQLAAWGADQKSRRAALHFMTAASQNRQQSLAWFSERKHLQEVLQQAISELQRERSAVKTAKGTLMVQQTLRSLGDLADRLDSFDVRRIVPRAELDRQFLQHENAPWMTATRRLQPGDLRAQAPRPVDHSYFPTRGETATPQVYAVHHNPVHQVVTTEQLQSMLGRLSMGQQIDSDPTSMEPGGGEKALPISVVHNPSPVPETSLGTPMSAGEGSIPIPVSISGLGSM